jgi:hypothetical protein
MAGQDIKRREVLRAIGIAGCCVPFSGLHEVGLRGRA